jgi:cell division septation protein DedD
VLYVLVFSFGVEKGKRFAIEELRAGKAKQEEISKGTTPTVPLTRESQLLPVTSRGESGAKEAATEPLQDTAPTPSGDSIASEHSASPGKYTIQIITFTSRSKAEKEVGRLKGFGHQSFVIPAGKFFQVSVGAFQNMTEAKDRLARLQSEGFASSDAFIRPLKGHIA